MLTPNHFEHPYREDLALADDLRVRIRTWTSRDKDQLVAGFQRLSPESRRARFLMQKDSLTAEDLASFDKIDGVNQFGLIALRLTTDDSEGELLGGARFIRTQDRGPVAEVSITIIDAFQNQGLGRLLIQRLTATAAQQGIKRLVFMFFRSNYRMRALIEHACVDLGVEQEGETNIITGCPLVFPHVPLAFAPAH